MSKKFLGLLLIIVLSVSMLMASVANSDYKAFSVITKQDGSLKIRFKLPDYEIKNVQMGNQSYQTIQMDKAVYTVDEGMPELPFFTLSVAVPKNSAPILQSIDLKETKSVNSIMIVPTQSLEEQNNNSFLKNQDFYSKSNVYPSQSIKISAVQTVRDYNIISINVFPFSFNPGKSSLEITKEVSFTVDSQCKSATEYENNTVISKSFEPVYRALIANYDEIRNPYAVYQQPSILIIHPNNNNVANSIQTLVNWKRQKGYYVKVASTSETGTTSNNIKSYITNLYNTSPNRPEYLIIVGDANGSLTIPTINANYGFYSGTGDYPYSFTAGNDYFGDLFVGRLSIDTDGTLQSIINKIIFYEKTPTQAGTTWLNQNLLVGDTVPSGASCISTNYYVKEQMQSYDPAHQFTELYGSEPSATSMQTTATNGLMYFNYRGYIGMSGFTNSNISGLNNSRKLFVGVWLTCDTGNFSSSTSISRIEAALRLGTTANPKGSIVTLGMSTSHTLTGYNNLMETGMAHGLFSLGMTDMGQAQLYSKIKLVQNYYSFSECAHDLAHWMNMMGDPSTTICRTIPNNMTVIHPTTIPTGTNNIAFSLKKSDDSPIIGAIVNISSSANEYYNAISDENGYATVIIPPTMTGPLTVTITRPDFLTYTSEITYQSDGIVSLESQSVSEIQGNSNGLINAGETIQLNSVFKNFSSSVITDANIIMQSSSPYITITDSLFTLASLSSNSTVAHSFIFNVAPNTPNNTIVPVRFKIQYSNITVYADIVLHILGVDVSVLSYQVNNDLNYVPTGTDANLKITVQNIGSNDLTNVNAVLRTDNPFVSIIDSLSSLGSLGVNSSIFNGSDPFVINVNQIVFTGTHIPFTVTFSNDNGFIKTCTFYINTASPTVVNPVGPDQYGYLMFDMSDTSYPEAPTYSWNSISTVGTNTNLTDSSDNGDNVTVKPLPFAFRFYGKNFNQISIGTNGWISFGSTQQTAMRNLMLPVSNAPANMVAACWSDLVFSGTGNGVFTYFDQTNHTFTIEWKNVRQYYEGSTSSTFSFQIILYDSQFYAGNPNDGVIKIQYNGYQAGYTGISDEPSMFTTVGLQNSNATDGLTYVYNNVYHSAAAPISAQKAIFITTFNNICNTGSNFTLPFEMIVNEDQIINMDISQYIEGFDPNDAASYSMTAPNTNHLTCAVNGLNLSITPQPNWSGYETIQINLTHFGETVSDMMQITVKPINDAPYLRQQFTPISFWDNHTYNLLNLNNYFADKDSLYGDHLVYSFIPSDSISVSIAASGVVTFTPLQNWFGSRNITFVARDDSMAICQGSVFVTVENVNEAPVINFPNYFSGIEDQTIQVNLTSYINDIDNSFNTLNILSSGSTNLTTTLNGAVLSITPTNNWSGSEYITISVSDNIRSNQKATSNRATAQDSVLINILPINDPPVINAVLPDTTDIYVYLNEPVTFTITATDVDNPILNYHWILNQVLQSSEGSTYSHTFQEEGTFTMTCNVFDNQITTSRTWTIHVSVGNLEIAVKRTELLANYPNPFNPSTRINYNLSKQQKVKINIYNSKGQLIKTLVNGLQNQGKYSVVWNGKNNKGNDVAAGLYFYSMETENYKKINKMLLLK